MRRFVPPRLLRLWRGRPRAGVPVPFAKAPDPARLAPYPGEQDLEPEIRDARLLSDAVAWQERTAAAPVRRRPPVASAKAVRDDEPARTLVNVLFVSHCDFTGNSALHVYSIASELCRRGFSPIVAVPENAESVADLGVPPFPVLTYGDARAGRLQFPNGRPVDLVHAFTPRERVRELTVDLVTTYRCPYVVHLEDNEEAILSAELGGITVEQLRRLPAPWLDKLIGPQQSHPLRAPALLDNAAGMTVIVDRLLEFKPERVPAAVVRAGFDETMLSPRRQREEVRAELDVTPDDLVIVYTGNIQPTNLTDVRGLYAAVKRLRRNGIRVVLVKTGWDSPEAARLPNLGKGIRELGWVPRGSVTELLGAADLLVQPGAPGPYNDYRLPSKLPEFLASGKPVVLPRTNIGLELRDGQDAVLLERGEEQEIYDAIVLLAGDAELRARIGGCGREFALRELRWPKTVDRIEELYREIAAADPAPVPAWALAGVEPPAKLIAFAPRRPSVDEAAAARAHGVYGFCLTPSAADDRRDPEDVLNVPFCFRIVGSEIAWDVPLELLASPAYIRVDGAPLLIADDVHAAERWRALAERETGGRVHFAHLQRSDADTPTPLGFDSAVETPRDALDDPFETEMRRRLATPLRDDLRFRSIAFPSRSDTTYAVWLRKLVLQSLLRAPAQAPFVFVDPADAWAEPGSYDAWLSETRAGLGDAIRQFYASQDLPVRDVEIDEMLEMA